MPHFQIELSSKQFEDYDDCLEAARAHFCEQFGVELWQVSARWDDEAQRDNIIVTTVEGDAE